MLKQFAAVAVLALLVAMLGGCAKQDATTEEGVEATTTTEVTTGN